MTNHPITPPDEMMEEWRTDYMGRGHAFIDVAKEIAQWGADQELKACCAATHTVYGKSLSDWLRNLRRPKPPSLKEQVSKALNRVPGPGSDSAYLRQWSRAEAASLVNDVRRTLEQLND